MSGDNGSGEDMTSRPGTAATLSPQQGTAVGKGSKVRLHRHPDCANGVKPERAIKYGLLAPVEPAELDGNPAAAEL